MTIQSLFRVFSLCYDAPMRPQERQAQIIDTVRIHGKAKVEELAKMFSTSVETIRRDLVTLDRRGKIEKVHGGAIPPRFVSESPFRERMQTNGLAKRQLARKALGLVIPGETLMIDTGSTTLVFAEELAQIDDLTVITNSTAIARVVASGNASAQVILLGGNYREDNRQTCGIMAVEQLNRFNANKAILTVGAINADNGVMDYDLEEALMGRAMLRQARLGVVLADSSKFGVSAPHIVAPLDGIGALVCERPPAAALASALKEARVEVHSPDAGDR